MDLVNYKKLWACGHGLALVFLLLWIGGCGTAKAPQTVPGQPAPYKVFGTWYQPMGDAEGFTQRGLASWYGKDFHGRKTSNGEIYDMYAMTAAHKTLPLGTYVRVKNLDNQRELDVRINDRGPFVAGRIIDLSYAGAKELGIVKPGTAPVEITALGLATKKAGDRQTYVQTDYEQGRFTVQVGAFLEQANARGLRDKLAESHENAHIVTFFDGQNTFYRVRVGRLTTLSQAIEYELTLKNSGYHAATIVAE